MLTLLQIEMTHDLDSVDLQGLLLDMRKQRFGLIQTHDQLRFSYYAILKGGGQILGMHEDFPDLEEEVEESEEDSDDSKPCSYVGTVVT